jgi:uncharacterized protein (TIGR00369 family)
MIKHEMTPDQYKARIEELLQYNKTSPLGSIARLVEIDLIDFDLEKKKTHFRHIVNGNDINRIHSVHGGFLTAIGDTCMSFSAGPLLQEDKVITTIDMHINTFRPFFLNDVMDVYCEILHLGKRTVHAQAKLFKDDELCTVVTQNYAVIPSQKVT